MGFCATPPMKQAHKRWGNRYATTYLAIILVSAPLFFSFSQVILENDLKCWSCKNAGSLKPRKVQVAVFDSAKPT